MARVATSREYFRLLNLIRGNQATTFRTQVSSRYICQSLKEMRTVKGQPSLVRFGTRGAAVIGVAFFLANPITSALCEPEDIKDKVKEKVHQLESEAQQWISGVISDLGPKLSLGMVMGVCSGYALKRIGQNVAMAVGVGFMSLQGLAYMGYIDIKWGKVAGDVEKALDTDGDGKLTQADAKNAFNKLLSILTAGLPGASGFASGMYIGVKYF
eukprot:TRINITY_DN1751_c0_g1::TRINITY_DN1751_c0_g1_i1::g.25145::m.25145 TRINITY_DN1751_c0_g1::TRINITY_DN1751_c0_g1_i1::g.25145  ORF type:complete len:213 (-),score=58.63,sp/Q4RY26/FUND1_TETNG/37.76/1e-08,FUN14/PF04930.10/1.5e+03,FUN14/PF04930.10/5e-20,EF-hand_7/PF13499.1/0.003,EF-hand_5/PF13202.1/0.046,EF-hand_6/PF13405.1/0.058,EF-hand_1/PF00036.27/0.13,DUF543/PF04418.7/0.2,DUF543/PF04418.7/4.2e+03,EF-hand_8/PF13833.1/0.26 TRINITY_DN1751_c0_g1_i1:413-1051(-)